MTSGLLQDDSEHSESIKQAFREHSEGNQKVKSTQRTLKEQSDFIIPLEPKILCLVEKLIEIFDIYVFYNLTLLL